MAKVKRTDEAGVRTVDLHVPMAEPDPKAYVASQSGHIDVTLGSGEARAMRSLHAGLVESGEKLSSGRPVVTKADVVRWLFERIANAEPSRN
jgi:hypothetical protein